jgi:hypothetical protein
LSNCNWYLEDGKAEVAKEQRQFSSENLGAGTPYLFYVNKLYVKSAELQAY